MNGKLIVGVAVGLMVVLLAIQSHRQATVMPPSEQGDSASVKGLATPRLPAARMQSTASAEQPAEDAHSTNLLRRILRGEESHLTAEQIGPYLEANHRSVESLLIAGRATGDRTFLQEAKEKYPHDPRVAFDALIWSKPEERRQWLDSFKQSAPDNALPDYMSALDHFKSGQKDQALQDLTAAASKSQFQDYSLDYLQNAEEAYRAAGYSEAEAKAAAGTSLLLPHLAPLKELGQNMSDLANSYRQAGDEASAQTTMQMVMNMGELLTEQTPGHALITDLVGLAIERRMLSALDPASPFGNSGGIVQDQLNQIIQRRTDLRDLAKPDENFLETLPEQDLSSYFDRRKMFGELAATRWVMTKYGRH